MACIGLFWPACAHRKGGGGGGHNRSKIGGIFSLKSDHGPLGVPVDVLLAHLWSVWAVLTARVSQKLIKLRHYGIIRGCEMITKCFPPGTNWSGKKYVFSPFCGCFGLFHVRPKKFWKGEKCATMTKDVAT